MKTDHIPDIYLEQYVLGELPKNLRKEIDDLIKKNPELNDRINEILKSNSDILSVYPAKAMVQKILERKNNIEKSSLNRNPVQKEAQLEAGIFISFRDSVKKFMIQLNSTRTKRLALSFSSAAVLGFLIIFLFPGIRNSFNINTGIETDVRIKGLDSKLLMYRMKGRNVEELKNYDTARRGDIIQAGYIATGDYRYGLILSIDGRGTVTLHFPDSLSSGQKLSLNKKILLNRSYELDDSPNFERFIMVLSAKPLNGAEIMKKAKKLAIDKESAINGSVKNKDDETEFSLIIKKIE